MSFASFAVLGVLCIVAVDTAAPKVGVSAPLGPDAARAPLKHVTRYV